jgi:transposase
MPSVESEGIDMRKLTVTNANRSRKIIQSEISRSEDARYDHRLHGLLMVGQGMSCAEVARWFGESVTTVERWVHRFNAAGLDGLREADHPGRPARLTGKQWVALEVDLRLSPRELGYHQNLWDGKLLAHHVAQAYQVRLGVRQCQRVFRKMGFRLRKPRPVIAEGDPELQAAYKKTPPDAP